VSSQETHPIFFFAIFAHFAGAERDRKTGSAFNL